MLKVPCDMKHRYVGVLPAPTDEAAVRSLFAPYGPVTAVNFSPGQVMVSLAHGEGLRLAALSLRPLLRHNRHALSAEGAPALRVLVAVHAVGQEEDVRCAFSRNTAPWFEEGGSSPCERFYSLFQHALLPGTA